MTKFTPQNKREQTAKARSCQACGHLEHEAIYDSCRFFRLAFNKNLANQKLCEEGEMN